MHNNHIDKVLGRNPKLRKKIILEYVKHPKGVADRVLAETLSIDHGDLKKQHLQILKKFNLIDEGDVDATRPMGRRKTPTEISMKGHHLNQDLSTLYDLVDTFNHDPDSQREFLRTQYYRNWIPELVERFDDSMPLHDIHDVKRWAEHYEDSSHLNDNVRYLADTYNRKVNTNNTLCCAIEFCKDRALVTYDLNGLSDEDMEVLKKYLIKHGLQLGDDDVFEDMTEKPSDHWTRIRYTTDPEAVVNDEIILIVKNRLSDEDKQCLATSLEDNWFTLKLILYFVSVTHNERDRILDRVNSDAGDARLSPWTSWEQGFDDALKRVEFKVCDAEALRPVYAERQKERQSEPLHNWIEFFDQLDRLNSNYHFLFDSIKSQTPEQPSDTPV